MSISEYARSLVIGLIAGSLFLAGLFAVLPPSSSEVSRAQRVPRVPRVPIATKVPDPYTAKLLCADCAAEGLNVWVWRVPGKRRGGISFEAPHNTEVKVVECKPANDGRSWCRVKYKGKDGWIQEYTIRRIY